jgi:hypothetical protein
LSPRGRARLINGALAVGSSLLTLTFLELVFRLLPPQTDGFGHTRASRRWFEHHWQPMNRYGYRDREHPDDQLEATRRLIVLGDSFAAGHGVADFRDCFFYRLGEGLGPEWSVILVANQGWNSDTERKWLKRFPFKPEKVVLSYYLNDIEGAAWSQGRSFAFDLEVKPALLRFWVERSDFFNWIYWRLRRASLSGQGFADWIDAAFQDQQIWARHQAELERLIELAQKLEAELVVVLFPHLLGLEASAAPLAKVQSVFADRGIATIDVRALLIEESWPPERRVVNRLDAHPSVELHSRVATALLERLRQEP